MAEQEELATNPSEGGQDKMTQPTDEWAQLEARITANEVELSTLRSDMTQRFTELEARVSSNESSIDLAGLRNMSTARSLAAHQDNVKEVMGELADRVVALVLDLLGRIEAIERRLNRGEE